MKEMHIYRGHEHFVINKKRKEKVYEMIEEKKIERGKERRKK